MTFHPYGQTIGNLGIGTAGQVLATNAAGTQAVWEAAPVDWLNVVTQYGADPTGVADSTTAIQNALNAVPTNGGTVYIPAGIYVITATLNPKVTGTRVQGAGWGSQIRYDGNVVTPAIGMADTTTRRCNISWLRISQTNVTAHGTAIEASYFVDSAIEHVLIDGGGSGVPPVIGISFNSATTLYNLVSDSRINCSGANSIGIRLDTAANSNVIRNVRVLPDGAVSSSIGIYVNSRSIFIAHADIESSAGTGISVGSSGHGCTVLSPYLEANGTNLAFASGVNCPVIVGGTIEAASTADFSDSGALTPMILNARSSSGGEHAYTKALIGNTRQPLDVGFIAWPFDPGILGNNSSLVNGTLYLIKVVLRYAVTITNLSIAIGTAATTATANQNFLLLYDSGGTLRGQTSAGQIDTATQTAGLVTAAMSATYAAAPGTYWVGFYLNAVTPAQLYRGNGDTGSIANAGVSAANYWFAVNGTGLTTVPPATITPGSNVLTGALPFWAAVS